MQIEPNVFRRLSLFLLVATLLLAGGRLTAAEPGLSVSDSSLRCEYRVNPLGIDTLRPRFNWIVVSDQRGESQTAYQIRVASSAKLLATDLPDLWDSGKVTSSETLQIQYDGKPLSSRQKCYWKVRTWDRNGIASDWSETAFWTMGLLEESDWKAEYISYEDESSISKDTSKLYLPAARQYRNAFSSEKEVARATVYSAALGIYELEINGARVGDAYFAPGWTDYRQRAYYNTYDVTDLVKRGENVIGARVADGWYSGYVGFGLLTGMGTERQGRWNYGKTPSLMTQMEVEYVDGTRATISTDATWTVTADGPIQEADLLMGEAYDARKEQPGWSSPGFDDANWDNAILARDMENVVADFYEAHNPENVGGGPRIQGTPRDLGFKRPRLESFPGVPVRITEELPAKKITEREPGTYVFDLGQNFAGVIRLKIKGPAGHRVQIRYAEMLHPDGRMMTENLRKARATDYYVCKGDPDGEIYQPRFTFHGFQFVEVANFPGEADLDTVTGLVMHSDTPMTSTFECSDPVVNQLFKNVVWTQRANFLDLPTDCPQRDERMGWTGDAQAYVGTAAYNADIGAFYTKWLRELMESQRESGAFPGYAPFPFQHGWDFGSAWADAGVICPWTIWQAYGDTRVIEDCWEPMTRFMQWREQTSDNDLGIVHGNAWGDWLAQGASTPLDYVDTVYFAISARMMSEMAEAIGHDKEAKAYRDQLQRTKKAFQAKYLRDDGSINVNTQTAQALALFADLVPAKQREATGRHLAKMIAENGNHMSTGFLGTRPLLPVLSSAGQHDLATFLLQSREFPSWGYEIENGATTIWERWDSYTKEDAFGRHNAAMNSFSHYAFGAVCEWMFDTLAGIKSDGPGYSKIIIHPHVPTPNSNAMVDVIDWVRASHDSIRGTIRSDWKIADGQFHLHVSIPANATATVVLPTEDPQSILESGKSAMDNVNVSKPRIDSGSTKFVVGSGDYEFTMPFAKQSARKGLVTSKPKDTSINPDGIDMTNAKELVRWDFDNPADVEKWTHVSNVKVEQRDGKAFLVATGNDSQMSTRLPKTVSGSIVIQLRAMPSKGATSQFFWALPERGFNGTQQNIRPLTASDQVNDYLFSVNETKPIRSIRFDPFNTYDEHANVGEMMIESISIFQLDDKQDSQQ
ncbi:glycoside hydrolase family 78 protein [Novipirellula rosea]|uniref:glycoside hydrolase family 78 protein n=1 Tax=Novipirellula rosea TaxID=1031540 RepID=UPI0031EED88F